MHGKAKAGNPEQRITLMPFALAISAIEMIFPATFSSFDGPMF